MTSEGGPRMTLSEHLDELRSRLLRCVLAAVLGFIVCFIFVDEVVGFLRRPLDAVAWKTVGLSCVEFRAETRRTLGLPAEQQGVLVEQVGMGSPAEIGGIHVGDVITGAAGGTVGNLEDLREVLIGPHSTVGLSGVRLGADRSPVPWNATVSLPVELVQTTAGGYVVAAMTVSLFAGLILAGPYILRQIWGFVAAGLYPHERRSVRYYAIPGFALFLAGAAMAYFAVLPWALDFLIGFASEVKSQLNVGDFFSLVAWMIFVFGLIFQLPLIMIFLMRLGVAEPAFFRRYRRHAIVVGFVVGAVLTPPDVVSQCLLSGTLILLYEGAILVGARVARRRGAAGA